MHVLSLPPAKPERKVSTATGGATTLRLRAHRTFAAFALLAVFMAAALALPAMASERHVEITKTATTTKLQASAKDVKVNQKVVLTVTVTPSKASGKIFLYIKAPSKPFEAAGTATLVHGVAKGQGSLPKVGTYKLKVVYEGSKSYKSSVSNPVTVVVQK